ncbi:MAG: PIG-L family deacetylase [Actinomycetota bacterium]|nr:PIG-L family deacetylase [Actinomycetota bacterium]
MTPRLTLMCVHAHPDDEAISTGGILARYAEEGHETILVTCTDGALGDAPGGVKPGEPGHTPDEVVVLRRAELEASCAALGVGHLELLGYRDSGMMGWPQNDAPGAFWHASVEEAAERVGALMARYRPQVVVTYDANGFYGHPDHIQAHRVTVGAVERTGIPEKLYYPAVPLSAIPRLAERLAARGVEVPSGMEDAPFGTPDEEIGAVVDCSAFSAAKYASLAAHASQAENIFFLSLGEEVFGQVFGEEAFVRALDRTGRPCPVGVEDDLFAGLRPRD